MNLVEFLFAFCTVFGASGFWLIWTNFVYKLEESDNKMQNNHTQGNHEILDINMELDKN